MVKNRSNNRQERLENFLQHLEEVRKLQDDFLKYGLDCVDLYVEDVNGDWLERWGEDEETLQREVLANQGFAWGNARVDISVIDFVSAFLASNYPAAVWARESNHPLAARVQQQLETEGLPRIIEHLQECLSITDEYDRLRAATNVLAGSAIDGETTRNSGDENDDEIMLLDLVESLLEKLASIGGDSAKFSEGE